jgi:hypothetical protein
MASQRAPTVAGTGCYETDIGVGARRRSDAAAETCLSAAREMIV